MVDVKQVGSDAAECRHKKKCKKMKNKGPLPDGRYDIDPHEGGVPMRSA